MSTNPRRGVPFKDALADYRAKLSPAEQSEFDEGVKRAAKEQAAERAAYSLAEVRKAIGMSQTEVAKARNVSQAAIAELEKKDVGVTQLRTLEAHLKGMGATLDLMATLPDGSRIRIPLKGGKPVKSRVETV